MATRAAPKDPRKMKMSGVCEQCGRRIRIRADWVPSADYIQWAAHIEEVQTMGIGASVCWTCYRYPGITIKAKKRTIKAKNEE